MTTQEKAGLAYLTREAETCERRIKKIRDNPDPKKPKSNLMLYECERDLRLAQAKAYTDGKPLGWVGMGGLGKALGLEIWDAIMAADRTHGEAAQKYFDIIRAENMAENTCDRTIVLIPMVMRGDFPSPDFLVITNFECMPVLMSHTLVANLLDVPYFMIDRPPTSLSRTENDEELIYLTDQIGELIEYVEAKIPGCKYDEDKLIELQHYDREYLISIRRLYELQKMIPCPLPGRESFREIRLPSTFPDPAKMVKYIQTYTSEIEEKAAKGDGAVYGEEKLRLLWSVSGPFFSDPFSWLEKRGYAIVGAEMTTYNGFRSGREAIYGDLWKGRKLTPLEEEARQFDYVWGRTGDYWVQAHTDSCRDLNADGIIYFHQWGCSVTNNLGKVVADTVEHELGIPTLLIEGRMLDESVFDEKDFFGRLEDFADLCLEIKTHPTQSK